MADRLFPQSDRFELLALGRILAEWANTDIQVETVEKGDRGSFTFDWLVHALDTCIGIEVVRAEDKDQLDHMEATFASGEGVASGSAEVPWASVGDAVVKKIERAKREGGYLDQVAELECSAVRLHLAVTSWVQELSWTPDQIWPELDKGLEVFDAVWLIHRDLVEAHHRS